MAFPNPISVARTVNTGSGAHVANYPASIASGDLLVLAALASANIGTVTGFTRIGDGLLASYGFDILVKIATGSESGSVSTGVASGNLGIYHMWRVTAATWSGDLADVDISAIAEGSSTTVNPPAVTAGWGAADNLFMTFAGIEEEDGFSAAPSGYSGLTSDTDAINTSLGSAWLQSSAASSDPGNWTFAGASSAWGAWTIVIRPAGAGAITGTAAVTLADHTSTASGTSTPPAVTGTVAVTLADQTASASGQAGIQGTASPVLDDASGAATGQLGASGAVAVTLEDHFSTASGLVAAGEILGSAAITLDDQTSTASGTVVNVFVGTVAVTLEDQVSSASGVVGTEGTAAVILEDHTSTATGVAFDPPVTGTVAVTLENFIVTALGVAYGIPGEGGLVGGGVGPSRLEGGLVAAGVSGGQGPSRISPSEDNPPGTSGGTGIPGTG